MTNDMHRDWVAEELDALRISGLYRDLPHIDGPPGPFITVDGERAMLLCSNNYLGLATDRRVIDAAVDATERFGASAGASRLVSGNHELYEELERKIAAFEQRESALVFSSGYLANIALMTTLADSDDVIFSDALNHASIVDGCRLSRARTVVFRHNDIEDLTEKIESATPFRRGLLVVEGVYSVDGDFAPLEALVTAARHRELTVVVDEAHATGVHGATGRGACELAGVSADVDIVMGTLGKALGSVGAFVACRTEVRELLINRARPLIYSTGLPPGALAAASASLDIVQHEPARRKTLLDHATRLRDAVWRMGYAVPTGNSQIVPIFIGDNDRALAFSQELLRRALFVRAIRPPSVPPATARLRVTPMATHTEDDISRALHAFETVGRDLGII